MQYPPFTDLHGLFIMTILHPKIQTFLEFSITYWGVVSSSPIRLFKSIVLGKIALVSDATVNNPNAKQS